MEYPTKKLMPKEIPMLEQAIKNFKMSYKSLATLTINKSGFILKIRIPEYEN